MAKKAAKKIGKKAAKRPVLRAVSKKTVSRRVAGVAGQDLPELPSEARALSRKYGAFW